MSWLESHVAFDGVLEFVLSDLQLIDRVSVEPKPRTGIEIPTQAQSVSGGDAATLVDCNSRDGNVKLERQPIYTLRQTPSQTIEC